MVSLTILNWQNRRATGPIDRAIAIFRADHPDCDVRQVVRPLSDFEHQGIAHVAGLYDLVVFDHPFCGDIANSRCFVPLEAVLPQWLGATSDEKYIGPSLATYRLAGHVWGAPIDGATQHAIFRPDLLGRLGHDVPRSHEDVLRLGRAARAKNLFLGTAIQSPHALMTIMSYMANIGQPFLANEAEIQDIPFDSFNRAYSALAEVLALSTRESTHWNSIDLHEAMVARDDVVYAPVVYGYATYGEADTRVPLSFGGFPGLLEPYQAGSAIGGAAIGLSRFSQFQAEATNFIRHVLCMSFDRRECGRHHGQAAAVDEWEAEENERRFNGFFSAVRPSMEKAWIRPRFPGYPRFQRLGGEFLAEELRKGSSPESVHNGLFALGKSVKVV